MRAAASPLIMLTAGGTGGHVFPAEALAEELMRRGYRLALVTDRRGQAYGGVLGRVETFRIRAGGIAGRGLTSKIKAVIDLGLGTIQALGLIRRMNPAVVVGFGGYASLPAMLAALLLGAPAMLHEQNAVLGRANRVLASRVRRVATSFRHVKFIESTDKHVVRTGMPVRPAILNESEKPYPAMDDKGRISILVMGGSQGAKALSEMVPDALARLPETLRARLKVSQQSRPESLALSRASYMRAGIDAECESFFADIPARLAASHLVISRAGASSVAEIACIGRPALLIPYRYAIDDHQTANAQELDEAGGGWLMREDTLSAEALAGRLSQLLSNPSTLVRSAACAKAVGQPDAAQKLADLVLELIPQHLEVN
ncbi:UDP-N-acetylglucosamine--N-acetylmuramyl-(pentapeptide) pyrophosphoryl-undecaprenol N-acetylglucosamine transferase [Rhodospirillaceae bacterium LM-1]|nr:UDP-N-acetylglucosamine--N-acetylmuramyl-(pentapeptide) pyrophosphoryl-undecaprenol N-acetylglucosamine transferase [Rhodospirillaceae bacterium LM-1]